MSEFVPVTPEILQAIFEVLEDGWKEAGRSYREALMNDEETEARNSIYHAYERVNDWLDEVADWSGSTPRITS